MAFDWATFLGENIGQAFKDIVGAFKVDPTTALQLQAALQQKQIELQEKIMEQVNAQVGVDNTEAASQKTFVAGWRPYIGWICGTAMAYAFIGQPLIVTIIQIVQCIHGHKTFDKSMLPIIDMSQMWPVLMGMLGFGALRTYEKVNGAPGADQLH